MAEASRASSSNSRVQWNLGRLEANLNSTSGHPNINEEKGRVGIHVPSLPSLALPLLFTLAVCVTGGPC